MSRALLASVMRVSILRPDSRDGGCDQEVVSRGVADPARIACGGHSYGAFMAANLLAHAGHLFACGIARSGAYNRCLQTLEPGPRLLYLKSLLALIILRDGFISLYKEHTKYFLVAPC